MVEDKFHCEDSSNCHKLNETMDRVDETSVAKHCHRLFVFLPVAGININSQRTMRCESIRGLYLCVLLLLSVWLAGCQLYPMLTNEFAKDSTWYISATDQYAVMAVVYVAALNNGAIGPLVKDLWSVYTETADDGANRRLKRLLCLYSLILPVYVLDIVGSTVTTAILTDNDSSSDFHKVYFGIKPKDFNVVHAINLVTVATDRYFVCVVYIFGCFNVTLCFLIKECFTGLNAKLKANGGQYFRDYLTKHRQISNLVSRYNWTFHPAILIQMGIVMMQLVTLTEDVTKYVKRSDLSLCIQTRVICVYMFYLLEMTVNFIIFIYCGHQIRCEAENGIDILLEASLSASPTPTDQPHDKSCQQLTTLFVAQLMTSPVAISASGLFDVNYNLITVVFTIGMTYITLLSTFKPNFSKGTTTAMSAYNCSICSLLNESSASPLTFN